VVGTFSYSLYLTHGFYITFLRKHADRVNLVETHFLVFFLVSIISATGVAFVYYWLFERPFLSNGAKRRQAKEQEAVRELAGVVKGG
jgi:peptidoglycan/LPS O-acetylase OafA/YrhL